MRARQDVARCREWWRPYGGGSRQQAAMRQRESGGIRASAGYHAAVVTLPSALCRYIRWHSRCHVYAGSRHNRDTSRCLIEHYINTFLLHFPLFSLHIFFFTVTMVYHHTVISLLLQFSSSSSYHISFTITFAFFIIFPLLSIMPLFNFHFLSINS